MTDQHGMTPSHRLAHVDGMLDYSREHGTIPLAAFESVRNHLAAVVNEHNALLAEREQLRDEYGIRADFTDTTLAEFTIAETLDDALEALAEFDAKHGNHVVNRELVQRPVGTWRKIGDEKR